jgi:hypothetical protein
LTRRGDHTGPTAPHGTNPIQPDPIILLRRAAAAHQAALDALAERLLAQAREELSAMQREAYDEEGVDVSLIRWMLSLTPLERLRTLDAQNRFVSLGRAALRSKGIPVPEGVG